MSPRNNSDFIDVKSLLKQYVSKWYLFVLSFAVCLGAAYLYTKIKQPVYAVRANVLISQENESEVSATSAMGALGSLFGASGYVEDEIFIVSSHSLYRDVARKLGINTSYYIKRGFMKNVLTFPESPISVTPQAGMLDTLSCGVEFKIKISDRGLADITARIHQTKVASIDDAPLPCVLETPFGPFTIAKTENYPEGKSLKAYVLVDSYDGAAEMLDDEVHAEIASKKSNVISLAINTTNVDYGKAILNEIIDLYNERCIGDKNGQTELTASFLDGRLEIIAADLQATERELQNYKQTQGIIDVKSEAKYQTEKRAKIEEELIRARTQEEIIAMTAQFLRDPENAYSMVPSVLDNEGLQRSIEAYNKRLLELDRLRQSARDDNSALIMEKKAIDASRANILASIDQARSTAAVAVNDLRNELGEIESSLEQIPQQEREYINIYRQQAVYSDLYLFLLKRREEASMMLANSTPKGKIVDAAYTMSEPLGMKKKIIFLIALCFGLILPPVYLYLRKLLNNRFEKRSEVESRTDVPILGEMCIDKSGETLVVTGNRSSSVAELFRLMRSNLLFIMNNASDKVVLVTSSSSGEGKSFISINLAATIAMLGKRVVLVGMDIRKPRLAEYLGISPRFGLTQYLTASSITLDSMITPMAGAPGMDVITAGPVPPNPAELLNSHKVEELFEELRARYDYVIVDTAPIGIVSDTFTLDRIADAAIYVCRANYTPLSDFNIVNEIYEQNRLKKLSIVVNGTETKKTYGYK